MLTVRRVTTSSDELKNFYQNLLAREKWRPGLEDVDCFLALDQEGTYALQVNDNPIGVCNLIKYDDGYGHFGGYVVDKDFRGLGYGSKFTEMVARKFLSQSKTFTLYSVQEMAEKYRDYFGVKLQWKVGRYDLNLSKVLKILQQNPASQSFDVKPFNGVGLQAFYNYDKSVFGYSREQFLNNWCQGRERYGGVALDKQGHIVGYVVVRRAFIRDEGYKVGPLFCDSIDVAKVLLKYAFEETLYQGTSSSQSVFMDSLIETNPEVKALVELLEGDCLAKFSYMATMGLPKGRFENWFALTAPEVG